RVVIRDLNPAYFTKNPNLDGSISLLAVLEGDGFELSENPWAFRVSQNPARDNFTQNEQRLFGHAAERPNTLAGQQMSGFEVSGHMSKTQAQVSGQAAFQQSSILFELQTKNYLDTAPEFSLLAQTEHFNLAHLAGMEGYSS